MTEPVDRPIRVLVVDDHQVVRLGLRGYLSMQSDIVVVGEAGDETSTFAELDRLSDEGGLPDVVLLDLMLPGSDGIAVLARLQHRFPAMQVVAVTTSSEPERVNAALQSGAVGYVLKGAPADEIAIAIRAAHQGRSHFDAVTARTVASLLRGRRESDPAALTTREREVLVLLAAGRSNRSIARQLAISERTAQTHTSNVLTKLGLESRTQAALWAVRNGLATEADEQRSGG
jgi:DNA-binding NarL/FixJ family response regulator